MRPPIKDEKIVNYRKVFYQECLENVPEKQRYILRNKICMERRVLQKLQARRFHLLQIPQSKGGHPATGS